MDNKIKEAQNILKDFGMPAAQQNQISALTLLALCNIKPNDSWQNAERISIGLNKGIMTFANTHYGMDYKDGSRESFRKMALNPFTEASIIEKNPDDPNLSLNSSNTHYAISLPALNTIRKYDTSEWDIALENFLKFKSQLNKNISNPGLVKTISINSYKSIANDTIELGRFNVFIGANGCGKTNILEALATVGAEQSNDLTFDGLYSRGVRIARPDLILSSFLDSKKDSIIDISLTVEINDKTEEYKYSLSPANINDVYTKWVNLDEKEIFEKLSDSLKKLMDHHPEGILAQDLALEVKKLTEELIHNEDKEFESLLIQYSIFDLNTKSLRGVSPTDSKKTPLGLNGEGLDLLIANFSKAERQQLNKCLSFFDWLEEVVSDKDDKLKLSGLKPGRSISNLYFRDKFMRKDNNTFSAENSNEGILHVLFYLALFISNKTPRFFAIDNIETALNPRLCQVLITELVKLTKENEKQVLITTHNPAILDGLNLLDDEVRLFEVYRDSDGHTKTRRIKFKKDLSDKSYKLSEMWLKGLLGAVPINF